MECNSVHISENNRTTTFFGTLVMAESHDKIRLEKRPSLMKKMEIAANTALDEPEDLLASVGLSVLKSVTNSGRAHIESPFGKDLSRNINIATLTVWSLSISDVTSVNNSGATLNIRVKNGKNCVIMFPSEGKAKKWEKVLSKLIRGESVFIW